MLRGGDGADRFVVDAGTDTIRDLGRGGADALLIAAGAQGRATLGASWNATAATVNAGTGTIFANGRDANLAAAIGNGWSISNAGDPNAVRLVGSRKEDTLEGGYGDDTLDGGAGNDTFAAAIGRSGRDVVLGGEGSDLLAFAVSRSALTAAVRDELARLEGHLRAGNAQTAFASDPLGLAQLRGVERVSVSVEGDAPQTLARFVELLRASPAPTARADGYAAVEDTALVVSAEFGLLANDGAGAGGLRAAAGRLATALGGAVEVVADGGFTYMPAADSNGQDSFSYTVTDAVGRSATGTATLAVTARPDAARIGGTANGEVAEDAAAATASGRLTIADADGAAEAVFRAVAPGDLVKDHGRFAFDAATGGWSYTLSNNSRAVQTLKGGETRADSLTVTSADGTATQTITVTIRGADDAAAIAPVRLSDVAAGTGGFAITGQDAGDWAGMSVAAAGDVNKDGRPDLVVGAGLRAKPADGSGAAYVVFGQDGPRSAVNLDDVAAGQGGFAITGRSGWFASWAIVGGSVSGAGDVNGDGFGDLLVGSHGSDDRGGNAGAVFVVFGKADTSPVSLMNVMSGSGGFPIYAQAAWDRLGEFAVASLGDINGDGRADLLVGANESDASGSNSGAAYVVYGKAAGGSVILSATAGSQGFRLPGAAAGDLAGRFLDDIGDMNGDGRRDMVIGAPGNDSGGADAGAAYVVWSPSTSQNTNLGFVAGLNRGFQITGEAAGDGAGRSVAAAGDVNGDGIPDVIIGAPNNDAGGAEAGAAYVVFGKADNAAVSLSQVAGGQGGFRITGASAGDMAGSAVASAGDLNGDGLADLLVGVPLSDVGGADAGAVYVVFGKANGTGVDLAQVAANRGGFVIVGAGAGDSAGYSVAPAGDLDGYGLADLLVGANGVDAGGSDAGQAYVIHGQADWLA